MMSRRTKAIFIIAAVLLTYGYIARWFSLYFFWDSKVMGWELVLVALISILFDNMAVRKTQNRRTTWNKVAIGVISLRVIIVFFLSIYIRFTDTYSFAMNHIKNDSELREELGIINSWGLMPRWSLTTITDTTGTSEFTIFTFTAHGDRKYRDLTIQLERNSENPDWHVTEVY